MAAPPKTLGPPKKPVTDYSNVAIQTTSPAQAAETRANESGGEPQDAETPRSRRPGYTRPVLERSKPVMLYLHPEGVKALERYKAELPGFARMHDIFLEAIEEWA